MCGREICSLVPHTPTTLHTTPPGELGLRSILSH